MTCCGRTKLFLLGIGLAVFIFPCGGCRQKTSDLDAKEERLPVMEEAKRRERSDDIDGAIELYQEVLDERPRLAKAHLQLGLLTDQYKKDYIGAIYHYQRYLELRPDTEKRPFIEELVRLARLSFATSIPDHPSDAIRELARMREEVETLEVALEAARKRIFGLNQTLSEMKRRGAIAERLPDSTVLGVSEGQPRVSQPRTYTVQRGDTLSKIAKKSYQDSSKWKMIYDANRDVMEGPGDLQVGQQLVLPGS